VIPARPSRCEAARLQTVQSTTVAAYLVLMYMISSAGV
jgi:hypothetical protein